jgi:hypothetical protein
VTGIDSVLAFFALLTMFSVPRLTPSLSAGVFTVKTEYCVPGDTDDELTDPPTVSDADVTTKLPPLPLLVTVNDGVGGVSSV